MTELIEVAPPDISRWANGNTGIEYVWTFDSGAPGPHCAIVALTHGNEYCGAIAVDALLAANVRPARGRLSLVFANVGAFLSFDENAPFKSRSLDEDFNRLWDETTLDSPRTSRDLARARVLRPFFDTVDHLLDLHSMQEACAPLLLCGLTQKGIAQAKAIGSPAHVLIDAGHAAGKRLFDYAQFGDDASPKTAYLVECGQHWAASSVDVAHESAAQFLQYFKLVATPSLEIEAGGQVATEIIAQNAKSAPQVLIEIPAQKVIEITHAVTVKRNGHFMWTQKWEGLMVVEKAGTALAIDAGEMIPTPYDHCVLIMPSREPIAGQTAVRLGRLVSA